MKNKVLLGNVLAFLTIIMWDFTYIVGKRLFEILDPVQVIFLRFLLATILFAIISVKEYHKKSIKQEMLFVLIGFILSFYFIFENTGLKITYASNVGFIVALLPIISAIIAHFFTHDEKITKNLMVGFGISLIGVVIIIFSEGIKPRITGDLLILIAMISWAIYSLILKKADFSKYSMFYISKKSFIYTSIFLGIFMLLVGKQNIPFQKITLNAYIGLFYLVVFATCLGFIFWERAISYIGIVKTSNILYLSPINTMIMASVFLGEHITFRKIVGGIITILGIYIAKKYAVNRNKEE